MSVAWVYWLVETVTSDPSAHTSSRVAVSGCPLVQLDRLVQSLEPPCHQTVPTGGGAGGGGHPWMQEALSRQGERLDGLDRRLRELAQRVESKPDVEALGDKADVAQIYAIEEFMNRFSDELRAVRAAHAKTLAHVRKTIAQALAQYVDAH